MSGLDVIDDCLLRMRVLLEGMLIIGEYGHLEADPKLSERSREWVKTNALPNALYDLRNMMDEMQEAVLEELERGMKNV